MTRAVGIVSAMLLSLLLLVPVVAAAGPWDLDEHVLFSSGGDLTLAEGQHADLLVVVDGTATIQGDAGAVLVLNGTANFVGSSTQGIVAFGSHISLDAGSVVHGDVRTANSTIARADGAVVDGTVGDLGPELARASTLFALLGFVAYLAFAATAIAAGLGLAGLAARQVREAEAIISREPVLAFVASLVGLCAIIVVATLAIVTVVGAPIGLAILIAGLPVLFVVGYLVTGIWIGDQVLARATPGVVRERPYLASVIGLIVLGIVSAIPVVGGLVILFGFGAVLLLMWRILRRDRRVSANAAQPAAAPSPS